MMDDDLRQDPPRSGEVWRVDFGPPDGHLAALVHCTPYEMDPGVVTSRLYSIAFSRRLEPLEVLRRRHGPLRRFTSHFADRQGWTL
jgi:hypothetical protein